MLARGRQQGLTVSDDGNGGGGAGSGGSSR